MGNNEQTPKTINVDGTEYPIDSLTPEVVECFNQVKNIDNQIERTSFNLRQQQGNRVFWKSELDKQIKIMEALKEEEVVEAA